MRDKALSAIGARGCIVVGVTLGPSIDHVVVRQQEIAARAGLIIGIDGAENAYNMRCNINWALVRKRAQAVTAKLHAPKYFVQLTYRERQSPIDSPPIQSDARHLQ